MSKQKINKICLYLVDDDPLICKILQSKFLQDFDYEITTYENGELFLQHIINSPVIKWNLNIIVIDHEFKASDVKRKDGIEIVKYLKEILPKAHTILLTSLLTDKLEKQAKLLGVRACVKKNENSYLRLQNIVTQIVSDYRLNRKRKAIKRLTMIFSSLLVIIILIILWGR